MMPFLSVHQSGEGVSAYRRSNLEHGGAATPTTPEARRLPPPVAPRTQPHKHSVPGNYSPSTPMKLIPANHEEQQDDRGDKDGVKKDGHGIYPVVTVGGRGPGRTPAINCACS